MSHADRIARLVVPGPIAVVFLLWLIAALLIHQPLFLNSDGDPARHIRHGLWILEQGSLIRADPFSFTRLGEPFVGFEYGSQVLFGLMHRAAGLAGVVALSLILVALTPALVAWFLLKKGVDPLLAMFGAILSGIVAQIHFVARPHLFTFLFTLILLYWLERDRRPPWWAFGFLFVVWVNLHGGVVFGLVLVGLYLLAALVKTPLPRARETALAETKSLGLILVVGGAALFLTPYGTALPFHLMDFFGEPFLRENTAEFRSPNFHKTIIKPFLVVLLAMMALLAKSRRPLPLRWLLVILATVGFALMAGRNIALFGLTALPLFLLHMDPVWRRMPDWRGLREGFGRGALVARSGGWILLASGTIGALALNGGRAFGVQVLEDQFDPEIFPVAIVQEARAEGVEGRLFHEFTWGGWLLYAWPEQRVFIDGGTDFYGKGIFSTYIDVRELAPGWRDLLEAHSIDHVLFPVDAPLVHELVREPGWGLRACDATGALLSRNMACTENAFDVLASCLETRRSMDSAGKSE